MARITSYRNLHKAYERVQLLYEVTMHSYTGLYDDGRAILRESGAESPVVEFRIGDRVKNRPLNVITYHAKDVYPELLRSTLLVRMVAVYEAFLIDSLLEVFERDPSRLYSSKIVEMTQAQMLALGSREQMLFHFAKKTTRALTSGGLKEIRKYYLAQLQIDIVAPEQSVTSVQEIHDRRHLHVHRAGIADDRYVHDYPNSGTVDGKRLPVDEPYFLEALGTLSASALHIKQQIEGRFPEPPHLAKKYVYGNLEIDGEFDALQFVRFRPRRNSRGEAYLDLSRSLPNGRSLKDITAWSSFDGNAVSMIIGGSVDEMQEFRKELQAAKISGEVDGIESFKIKRGA